jgi:hypothetical protein
MFGASGTGSSCNNLIRVCAPSYRPQGMDQFLHSMHIDWESMQEIGSRTFSSLRSRGELLVRSLSDLDWCLSVTGSSGFAPCMWHTTGSIDANQRKFGLRNGKSWYERGALTCHLVALMGSGQQRCNYEVSRANPFENDPREEKCCLQANPIMPRGGEPFDEACTHWEKGIIDLARVSR